jgi:hypothetical protein
MLERIEMAFRRNLDEVAIDVLATQGDDGVPLRLRRFTLAEPGGHRRGETSDRSSSQSRGYPK